MKILLICSKAFYSKTPEIKIRLEAAGHMVELPNCWDAPETENEMRSQGKAAHQEFKARMFRRSLSLVRESDAVLVLNYDKQTGAGLQKNYIGGATFLEMYDAFLEGKKIYLYHDIPDAIFSDEIEGFGVQVIHEDLSLIKDEEKRAIAAQIPMSKEYPNLTFIYGGARSGKSTFAEKLAAEAGSRILYTATAEILDDEMKRRVGLHQARRPASWMTLEAPSQVGKKLDETLMKHYLADAVLLDCISILTSNILLKLPDGTTEMDAWTALQQQELIPLFETISRYPTVKWIIVSNETGMGIVPAYPLGRLYRDVLGRTNQFLAARAKGVYLMSAGVPIKIKG